MRTRAKVTARSGFTLIEVMLAVTVLLVAVLSTFITQVVSHDLLRTSHETSTAMSDLEMAMEQVLLMDVDHAPLSSSPFADGVPCAQFEGLHLRDEVLVVTYPGYVAGSVPDPLPIVVAVSWSDFKGRARTLRLMSMKAR